jgi:transitional endoplasmic reticulum ATPase
VASGQLDNAIFIMASQSDMTPGQEKPASSGVAANNYQGREANVLWDRSVTAEYYKHATAPRVSTNTVAARALKAQYPSLELTITYSHVVPLLAFAAAGHAEYTPLADTDVALPALRQKNYHPPARRLDGDQGSVGEATSFGKFHYKWSGHEFIVYLIDCHEGTAAYPSFMNFYILSTSTHLTDQLVLAAGHWADDLHDEVWVFDGGMWYKSRELYYSVRNASWENVILDEDIKKTLIEDHMSFFRSRETYAGLKVPWKRGIIYYGPPGNGKTISIKATMNMLNRNEPRIPTLYVRTLTSYMGPEASVKQIFAKARQFAPCYLVLEDLDTIISDSVRSYFLNEVDGLKNNDGIFMVGSTNHLDRLDPGISVSPSLLI